MAVSQSVLVFEEVVDCTQVGNTCMAQWYPGDHTVDLYPAMAGLNIVEQSGVLVGATVSIGTNAPNYNNMMSARLIGGLNVPDVPIPAEPQPTSEGEVFARVSAAATGLGPTLNVRAWIMVWGRFTS